MGEAAHAAAPGACGNPVGVAELGVLVGTIGCAGGVDEIGGEKAATPGWTPGGALATPTADGGAGERFAGNALVQPTREQAASWLAARVPRIGEV